VAALSEDHQLSYTIPSFHVREGGDRIYGLGDISVGYRYQVVEEGDSKPAFAPEFSLILPSGNRDRGTGDGVLGYEWTLPFSKKLITRLDKHFARSTRSTFFCLPQNREISWCAGRLIPRK
jgi:hypothetical protein